MINKQNKTKMEKKVLTSAEVKTQLLEEMILNRVEKDYPLVKEAMGKNMPVMTRYLTEWWVRHNLPLKEIKGRLERYLARVNRTLERDETEEDRQETVEWEILNETGRQVKELLEEYHPGEIRKEEILSYCLEQQISYSKIKEAMIASGEQELVAESLVREMVTADFMTSEKAEKDEE